MRSDGSSAPSASCASAGIDAHGQVAHPDPSPPPSRRSREERVDEIIVSTFGPERSGWLRQATSSQRLRNETKLPGRASWSPTSEVARLMAAHAEAIITGRPIAHQSSRVSASVLGMLLFIASEVMLFGAFFTAYFFVRVVNGIEWPTPPFELPVFIAGVNTAILVTSSFTMHWALPVDQARQPRGAAGRACCSRS